MADKILPKGNYINGSFLKPTRIDNYIERPNPGNLADRGGRFPVSIGSVDHAVSCAQQAYKKWRDTPFLERAAALRRFRENLDAHRDRLADAITRESGKPRWESLAEVNLMMAKVDITLDGGELWLKPSHAPRRKLLPLSETLLVDVRSDFRFTALRDD